MIRLSNFESIVPFKILSRGEKYYDENAVSELEEYSPGEWNAIVSGTEDYEVDISLSGDEIEAWSCDCPFEGEICKHVVATLLAIRNYLSKTACFRNETARIQVQIDEDIKQILSCADPKQLLRFIEEYASTHADFKTALFDKFLPKKLSDGLSANYMLKIKACFDAYRPRYYSRSRYNAENSDWVKVFGKVDQYLTKAHLLLQQDALGDAAAIALQILRSVGENYLNEDFMYLDEIGIEDYCETSHKLLRQIIPNTNTTQKLKEEILQNLIDINKLPAYTDYDICDVEGLLLLANIYTQPKEKALALADQMIREREERNDPGLSQLVLYNIQILEKFNELEKAKATLQNYLYLPDIREQEVNKLINSLQYDKALLLLDDGIKKAIKEGETYTAGKWRERQLFIYETTNNVPKCIELYRELFISSGELTYYHKLKSLIPTDQWKGYLDTLMGETKFYDYMGFGKSTIADIYVEEKEYERLYKMILSVPSYRQLEALSEYAHHLKDFYSPELLALYTDRVCDYAENNLGRNHYEYIAKILQNMKKLKEGDEVVRHVVQEFRNTYKRRPAMMSVLKGL